MSITSALSSALTGLQATSRQSEVIASNVANASTPGYARRTVSLSALYLGGSGNGVRVVGIDRNSDLYLLNERRIAQAETGSATVKSKFYSQLEVILGNNESGDSLVSRLNALESQLITAAGNPESEASLATAVQAAISVSSSLNAASKNIQAERLAADKSIAMAVTDLNQALATVEELNKSIATFKGTGRDVSSLIDQRQQVIDQIADIIPLREVLREKDQIALISTGGAVLLDGKAAVIEFTGVQFMEPEMSINAGGLSGLKINGREMATQGDSSFIKGGSLASLFEIRDDISVKAQAKLDGFAADLIERFAATGFDPSLPAGDPGLFTDQGQALNQTSTIGLAGRIQVNAAVRSDAGGKVSNLRDGLGAGAVSQKGDSTLLAKYAAAMNANQSTSSSAFSSGSRNVFSLASEFLSFASSQRLYAQQEQSFNSARLYALYDLEAAAGVDTDTELQTLLVVEKNYAANAKVIKAVDEMLTILLSI